MKLINILILFSIAITTLPTNVLFAGEKEDHKHGAKQTLDPKKGIIRRRAQAEKLRAQKRSEVLEAQRNSRSENYQGIPDEDRSAGNALVNVIQRRHMQQANFQQELNDHAVRKNITINPNRRTQRISDTPLKVVDLQGIGLTQQGYPTYDTIRDLVSEYWPALGKIGIKKLAGGANTGIIYGISNEQGKFIFVFKISTVNTEKNHQAWENLAAIQASRIGRLSPGLKTNANAPIITPVERFFRYFNGKHQRCVIEVTHAAQGDYINKILDGIVVLSPYERQLYGSFIGKALGILHSSFITNTEQRPEQWLTVNHGDFHANNVFIKYFSKNFCRVYLIDNETIRQSLDELQPIDWDIIEFMFLPILYWQHLTAQKISDEQWSNNLDFYTAFLNGYLEAYPEERRKELSLYLKILVNSWFQIAIDCIEEMQTQGRVNLNNHRFKPFTNSDAKSATWEGYVGFIKANINESHSMIARLKEGQKKILGAAPTPMPIR